MWACMWWKTWTAMLGLIWLILLIHEMKLLESEFLCVWHPYNFIYPALRFSQVKMYHISPMYRVGGSARQDGDRHGVIGFHGRFLHLKFTLWSVLKWVVEIICINSMVCIPSLFFLLLLFFKEWVSGPKGTGHQFWALVSKYFSLEILSLWIISFRIKLFMKKHLSTASFIAVIMNSSLAGKIITALFTQTGIFLPKNIRKQ